MLADAADKRNLGNKNQRKILRKYRPSKKKGSKKEITKDAKKVKYKNDSFLSNFPSGSLST